jgi:methyltransferase (TIGR00027 family)
MTTSAITHVSDTALWVAIYRAMESERPDALFHDPYARTLAGQRGEQIVATLKKGRRFAWPMIVRTAVMDEIILRAANRDGVDTVLNLAAGLDTRPYRLALPRTLRWFDVDLPPMVEYKQQALRSATPACALEYVKADLTDAAARRDLFGRAASGGRKALAITEGLLVYLTPEQVAALATDLAAAPGVRWWMTDMGSPKLLKLLERTWGKQLRAGNAPFRFAPAEGTAFFEGLGWTEIEFRSIWQESLRLKRTIPLARFWNLLSRLSSKRVREENRRMSGVVLLQRR